MAVYRATRTAPDSQWQYRIDIVPYDANIDDAVTTLDDGTIVDIGDLSYGFDDVLPYGLAGPATWSVTLNFSRLPSALQTYLRNRVSGPARNTFLYWTDSGTSGATWTLLFCGVVENTESIQYDTNDAGELEADFALLDGAYNTLLDTSGDISGAFISGGYDGYQLANKLYDVRQEDGYNLYYNTNFPQGKSSEISATKCVTWNTLMTTLRTYISVRVEAQVARSANSTPLTTGFDPNLRMADLINTGARFYTATSTGARAKDTQVTDSDTYLAYRIETFSSSDSIGGVVDDNDEYSFSQAQCLKDLLSDLCETFCVKMWWSPTYVTDGSGDYITWDVVVAPWLSNGRANGTATSMDLDTAVSVGSIIEGSGVIGKAEARVQLEGDDKNVTEWVTTSARSRSERSINVEPILHNLPTYKDIGTTSVTFTDGKERWVKGFGQTNILMRNYQTPPQFQLEKLHEDVRVVVRGVADGGTETTFYDVTTTDQIVSGGEEEHKLWLTSVQSNAGLPKAITKAAYSAFSSETQAEAQATWRTQADTLISNLGLVHDLSGGASTDLTHLAWDKACITSVTHSFANGTCDVTYFLPGV